MVCTYIMLTAQYIDTCMPCYLLDSYSRDGQTLLLSSLGLSLEGTVRALIDSIDSDAGIPEGVSDDDLASVIGEAIQGVDLRAINAEGNRTTDPIETDGDEPYLYVLLEWEVG
jgi:hypothetical protein